MTVDLKINQLPLFYPEGGNIQRYLQCAVNEKNPIAPYYSINTVTKNKAKGFFVKQETRH